MFSVGMLRGMNKDLIGLHFIFASELDVRLLMLKNLSPASAWKLTASLLDVVSVILICIEL
jgi:hypothetical protein